MKSFILVLLLSFLAFYHDSFREEQKRYPRVRQAYNDKESAINAVLVKNAINKEGLNIYLRAFKAEKKLELWPKVLLMCHTN